MPSGIIGKCIYCQDGVDKPLSKEHFLSRGFGNFRDYETLDDRICSPCNNSFRDLEEQLLRGSSEAFYRELLNIQGRRRTERINPFRRGSAGSTPLRMVGDFPGTNIPVLYELHPGRTSAEPMSQIVFKVGETHIQIPIPEEMDDQLQFKELIVSQGASVSDRAFVTIKESEVDRVSRLLNCLEQDGQTEWERSPTEGRVMTVLTYTVTDRYFRALAKIGFHYFLKHIRVLSGAEDAFADIRRFIKTGGEVRRFVSYTTDQFFSPLHFGYVPTTYMHILYARATYRDMFSRLQLFFGPEYLQPVFTIHLGQNPMRIFADQMVAHSFEYYVNRPQDGYDGKMSEIPLIRLSAGV